MSHAELGSPSTLDSGRASLLPPSEGAENCEGPPPPPTWMYFHRQLDGQLFAKRGRLQCNKPGWRFHRQNRSPSHPERKE